LEIRGKAKAYLPIWGGFTNTIWIQRGFLPIWEYFHKGTKIWP